MNPTALLGVFPRYKKGTPAPLDGLGLPSADQQGCGNQGLRGDVVAPSACPTVEDQWSPQQLRELFVVRDEFHNKFMVWKTYQDFYNYLEQLPEEQQCFHEVIRGDQKQKLKFDIDAPMEKLAKHQKPGEFFEQLLDQLKLSVLSQLFAIYNVVADEDDVLVCRSQPVTEKYSAHVILNKHCVINNKQAQYFTERVCNELPTEYNELIDMGVNKSTQNFRMPLCHKVGSERVKYLPTGASISDALITRGAARPLNPADAESPSDPPGTGSGWIVLPEIPLVGNDNDQQAPIQLQNLDEVLTMAKAYIEPAFKFDRQVNNALFFKRVAPSFCTFCNRIHEHDNSLMITLNRDPTSYTINIKAHCLRAAKGTTIPAQVGEISDGKVPEIITSDLLTQIDACCASTPIGKMHGSGKKNFNRTQYYLNLAQPPNVDYVTQHAEVVTTVSERTLAPYPLHKSLLVRAPMKMGKTKTLIKFIEGEAAPPLKPLGVFSRIVMLSFRQTFSQQLHTRFPDFTLYNNVRGDISLDVTPRLIIQCESLHRLIIPNGPIDLLVMDESESIIEQLTSGLSKNFAIMFAKFVWLMRYAKHAVFMDANLSIRTAQIVERFRGSYRLYESTYKPSADDTHYLTDNAVIWWDKLVSDVSAGKHVCITSNSCTELEERFGELKALFPNKTMKLYTSHTPVEEKRNDFKNIDEVWSKYEIVAYTPTVLAGVSFERPWFDKVYCLFTDMSCTVESCRQMMGRVRDVKDKEYVILLHAHRKWYPPTIEKLEESLVRQKNTLFGVLDPSTLAIEYSATGKVSVAKDDRYVIYLHNLFAKCLSQNNFMARFIAQLRETGATLRELPPPVGGLRQDALAIRTGTIAEQIHMDRPTRIADAADLTHEQAALIQASVEDQLDVKVEDMYAFEKYNLKKFYSITDPTFKMTPIFVQQYGDKSIKHIYRNLSEMNNFTEPFEPYLARLQMTSRQIENGVPPFTRHYLALLVIKVAGFVRKGTPSLVTVDEGTPQSPPDGSIVLFGQQHARNIVAVLEDFKKEWQTMLAPNEAMFQLVFGAKLPALAPIQVVHFISKVIQPVYGIRVLKSKQMPHAKLYYIERSELFVGRAAPHPCG